MVQLTSEPRNRQKERWKTFDWDRYTKALVKEHPQEIVDYLVPGARFICFREGQFQTEVDSPFKPRDTRSDVMMEVMYRGTRFLLHVELQSTKDERMDERLLSYRCDAVRLHGLEVWSCVIYLRKVKDTPKPPMKREAWKGQPTVHFTYRNIELAFQPVDELRQYNLDVLQPLMLLCKGGAKREVLEEVLTRLKEGNKGELISLARFFAGMVFHSKADKAWIRRRFAVLKDYLREHSWTFKETLEEGREEGLVKGREEGRVEGRKEGRVKGREEGRVEGRKEGRVEGGVEQVQRSIEAFVQVRFPALLASVKSQMTSMTDLEKLQRFLLAVGLAQTEDEVKKALAAL